jgi:putative membrane protein
VSAVAVTLYVLAAAVYAIGFRRAQRRPDDDKPSVRDAVLVQGGLLVALLALVTPLSHWSEVYLWVRATQDIVLAFVAPALIAIGRPWLVTRRLGQAAPSRAQTSHAEHSRAQPSQAEPPVPAFEGNDEAILAGDLPEPEPRWSKAAWPLAAVVLFNVAWLGWHVPVAFDLAQRNSLVRAAEQACYLGVGTWFWLEVARPHPGGYWHRPLRRLGMVTATVAAGTILGMALVFGSNVVYPAYHNAAHHIMTVLDDQQLSGAVLWMGALPSLIVAGVALLNNWLNEEEREAPADAGVLSRRRTSGWPARPRLR